MKFKKPKTPLQLVKDFSVYHIDFCATDHSDSYNELKIIESKWNDICETDIEDVIKSEIKYSEIYKKELLEYAKNRELTDDDFCVANTVFTLKECN